MQDDIGRTASPVNRSTTDRNGKVLGMKEGVPMETKDGQVIMMKGNEIWRKMTTEKQWDELYRGQ
jgi:hypothetical protein